MNVREYLELREGRDARVQRLGDGSHLVTCPAHDDRNPSLHVTEGRHGCVLLKCHAGCSTGADVVAADRIELADLFPEEGQGNGRVEVAIYDYIESGASAVQAVRFHPKGFKQRRPRAGGGRASRRPSGPSAAEGLGRCRQARRCTSSRARRTCTRWSARETWRRATRWAREVASGVRRVAARRERDRRRRPGRKDKTTRGGSPRAGGRAASVTSSKPPRARTRPTIWRPAGRWRFVPVDLHDAARGDGNGEDHLHHGEDRRVSDHDLTVLVIDAVKRYQALEDTDVIRVTLAVAVTSESDDEPLWLQIVGGPSSGKSEAIAMLREIADGRIGEVTVAGLLGWSGTKNGKMTGLRPRDRRRPQARRRHPISRPCSLIPTEAVARRCSASCACCTTATRFARSTPRPGRLSGEAA